MAYGDGSRALAGTVTGMTCTGPAHTYTAYGTYQVTVTVTDKDGGVGSASSHPQVIWAFTGFFSPVDNPPALNTMKAGAAVPVKFGLGGDQGLAVFAAGYPTSERIACDSSSSLDPVEETTTAGASSLAYDAAHGPVPLHLEDRQGLGQLVPAARRPARGWHRPHGPVQVHEVGERADVRSPRSHEPRQLPGLMSSCRTLQGPGRA